MDFAAVDFAALVLALLIALVITVVLVLAHRGESHRRGWIAAATSMAVLLAIFLADLLQETPRQTHVATAIFGAILPVLGTLGMIRGTRGVRPWIRWPLVYLTALLLLLGGLLFGAAMVPRFLD